MTRTILGPTGSKRRWWSLATAVMAAFVFAVVFVAASGATTATVFTCPTLNTLDATANTGGVSNFEIDKANSAIVKSKTVNTAGANLTLDNPSPCLDWTTKAQGSGRGTAADLTAGVIVKPDLASGAGDDSFTQGTSENSTTPTISTGSIPPNKSDLQDFGIYKESNGTGKFLNLFWSRVNAPSGTVDMDFELNKVSCGGTAATCSNNGTNGTTNYVTPLRSNGDRLVTYDLASGGTVPTISIYTWTGNANSGSWTNGTVISGPTGDALGSINFDPIASGDSGGLGAKDPLTFGEVSISYKALFGSGGTTGCGSFGSVYLKSRSSNTFTDELKDFVAPQPVAITNCTGLTTSASNATTQTEQTIGGSISDTATLSGALSPSNGVVFNAYGPFDPTTAFSADVCTNGAGGNNVFTSSPQTLTGPDGSGNYSASSGAFTPASAGRYEWIASYAADGNNGTSTTKCGDASEQSLVGPATPTLVTSATNATTLAAQALGGTISDSATLSGTALEPDGSTKAQGTITFTAFYNDNTCAATHLVFTSSTVAVNGDNTYGPVSFTPKAAGTYYWIASYSGDSPNTTPKAGTCGDAGETSIVMPNQPTISTSATAGPVTLGAALDDTATLSGTALEPDGTTKAQGTITFNLYGPFTTTGVCTGNAIATVTISVNGDGSYKASDGAVTAGSLTPTQAGTYNWTASYNGDSPNTNPVSEPCGGTNESSVIVKLNSTISTAQSWTPQDTATIDHSGGTVVFTLYKDSCTTGTVVFGPTDPISVTGSGPYTASTANSISVTAASNANYYWKAAYNSGDASHKDVTSSCQEVSTLSIANGSPVTSQ